MTAPFRNAEGDRLLNSSDELSGVPGKLTRLAGNFNGSEQRVNELAERNILLSKRVRDVIRARRLRSRFLPDDLFADPAWDMLLELLSAELAQHRISVSSLCVAAAVPPTTALRWLNSLVERRLVVRHSDPHDGRRVFVELSGETSAALRSYFAETDSHPI